MLTEKELNKLAKKIKTTNKENKSFNHSELEKATLKDLKILLRSKEQSDFTEVYKTKMYNKLSCGYCIALEIISNYNLI